jgi:hypothetical protein
MGFDDDRDARVVLVPPRLPLRSPDTVRLVTVSLFRLRLLAA